MSDVDVLPTEGSSEPQRRPATTPRKYRTWRHGLLLERIRDLNDAKMKAFTAGDGLFYGSPRSVRLLIGGAIDAFEDDDLGKAERCCEVAERKIISEARKFQMKSPAEKLAYANELNQ
jgi:hypothetical protein